MLVVERIAGRVRLILTEIGDARGVDRAVMRAGHDHDYGLAACRWNVGARRVAGACGHGAGAEGADLDGPMRAGARRGCRLRLADWRELGEAADRVSGDHVQRYVILRRLLR